jgi:hypothetical protein
MNKNNVWIAEMLPHYIREGLTAAQIAEELDTTQHNVRLLSYKHGLKIPNGKHPVYSVRELAKDMKPLDAVEYLLGVIEQLEEIKFVAPVERNAWGVHWRPQEARVLGALMATPNNMVSHESLYNALTYDRVDADELPHTNLLKVIVSHIRRKLPEEKGTVVLIWGQGYKWVPG